MSGLQEALYFPFLRFKNDSIEKISSFFSKIYLLSLPNSGITPLPNTGSLQPKNLNPVFLETLARIFDEKLSFSGPESLQFLMSEKKEPLPSLSALVGGVAGKAFEMEEGTERLENEGLHLAALLLARVEELDFIQDELGRELAIIDQAEKEMFRELTGEEEVLDGWRKPAPDHLEARMLAWLKLLGACGAVPSLWITDMSDAERLLEKMFPEAVAGRVPSELERATDKEGAIFLLEIPLNAAKLSGISFSGETESLKVLYFG